MLTRPKGIELECRNLTSYSILKMNNSETIVAVATGIGGALAVIRMSGRDAIAIADSVFRPASGKPLSESDGYTLHYGEIIERTDGRDSETASKSFKTDNKYGEIGECTATQNSMTTGQTVGKVPETISQKVLDDVIVSVFRAPKSYTGEDMVEISCHGSQYIQREIVNLLIRKGARAAEAGEFTLRSFLAGKLDLSQAEAVADMIAATDRATHALASTQMRGGYSADLSALRNELLTLASLLELELDFGEEDVEFADRERLLELLGKIEKKISALAESFSLGNVLKEGVAVAIVGSPNVGKSTLLNALLRDDRAMVSDIAGTTRDVIEESVNIGGMRFRFLDTAGIRQTSDPLEQMGIDRTYLSIAKANIILLMVEAGRDMAHTTDNIMRALQHIDPAPGQRLCIIINKIDKSDCQTIEIAGSSYDIIALSAKTGHNLNVLIDYLVSYAYVDSVHTGTIVSNIRHYESLVYASEALTRAHEGLERSLAPDLLAQDIREALHHMGTITGEITTDEILSSIFSKFCIGK